MSPLSIDRQTITTGHVHGTARERTAFVDQMPNRATSRTTDLRPTPGAAACNYFRVVLARKVRFTGRTEQQARGAPEA